MTRGFRLGVVLRLRELAEDAARAELATALRVHRSALDAHRGSILAAAAECERASAIQCESGRPSARPAGDLVDAIASIELAQEAMITCQAQVVAAAGRLLEARSRLADATSRRKVVERLRDRAAASERLLLQRAEDALLNEVASTRHAWAAVEESLR